MSNHIVLSSYMRHRDTLHISETSVYFTEFYQRNLPSESNWQISIFSLSCHPVALSPDSLNHHTKQHKSCTTIVMYEWVLNYLWKCDFSSNDPTVFNCLQQGPRQLEMSPHSPLGVLGSPLSPQNFRKVMFCTRHLCCVGARKHPAWLPLTLQLNLVLPSGPEKKSWLSPAGWRKSANQVWNFHRLEGVYLSAEKEVQGEDLTRIWQVLWNSHSPGRAPLLTPEMAGRARGPAETVHVDTCEESTAELWRWAGLAVLEVPLTLTLSTPAETLVAIRRKEWQND